MLSTCFDSFGLASAILDFLLNNIINSAVNFWEHSRIVGGSAR
ncbi:hypothetical protein SynBIOSE41_03648 [Synechococcus sp. BIOS-E4-1]|nr:hypothetical protein SynBIOSE41_03648 [Synechococcus sp. BIOS-E4-1]